MSVVIRTEQLSKAYSLGVINRRVFAHEWWLKLTGRKESQDKLFWALKDIDLDVRDGEILGLLGRNGAGKSTLLKVISQITTPTRGCIKIRGRIASLLEVGTGFHPDLTGRDNIFLNGAILGMSRREVAARFDAIVEFSGVETFIDTPVKRYSVGMRVRLAFAVAAHLDPEILLVDEVLAVGDAVFQQKCLGKMGEVARSGRTVLLVSHNAAAIEALCTRGVVIEGGRIVFDGTQTEAIEFFAESRMTKGVSLGDRLDRTGSGEIHVEHIGLFDADGAPLSVARSGKDVELRLEFQRRGAASSPRLSMQISVTTNLGIVVFTHGTWLTGDVFGDLPERGAFVCRLPRLALPPGHYHLSYCIHADPRRREIIDALENAFDLHVESGDFFGTGKLPRPQQGVVLVEGAWRLEAGGGA